MDAKTASTDANAIFGSTSSRLAATDAWFNFCSRISPPVANATAPLVAVPLNERTKEVAGDAYEPSFVVMSRETVRQLAHQREAANQQVLKHRATSAAHAHASFASRATQRRAAEAIAETMAKISRLHPNQ